MNEEINLIEKECSLCDNVFAVEIQEDGKYENGHYFGEIKVPIGVGENIPTGEKLWGCPVVNWSGKEKTIEYWECDDCFNKEED